MRGAAEEHLPAGGPARGRGLLTRPRTFRPSFHASPVCASFCPSVRHPSACPAICSHFYPAFHTSCTAHPSIQEARPVGTGRGGGNPGAEVQCLPGNEPGALSCRCRRPQPCSIHTPSAGPTAHGQPCPWRGAPAPRAGPRRPGRGPGGARRSRRPFSVSFPERGAPGRGGGHQPADGVLLLRALLRHLLQVLGAGHRPRPAHRRAGPSAAQRPR